MSNLVSKGLSSTLSVIQELPEGENIPIARANSVAVGLGLGGSES